MTIEIRVQESGYQNRKSEITQFCNHKVTKIELAHDESIRFLEQKHRVVQCKHKVSSSSSFS